MDFHCSYCANTLHHRIEKYCPKCDKTLPHVDFYPHKSRPDGLTAWCKSCEQAQRKTPEKRAHMTNWMREWRKKHPGRHNQLSLESYYRQQERRLTDPALDQRLKEKSQRATSNYRLRHPDRIKETQKRWYDTHKAQKQAASLAFYYVLKELRTKDAVLDLHYRIRNRIYAMRKRLNHPETMQAVGARYRARKRNAPINDFTKDQWQALKQHFGYRCVYCGKKPKRLTMDHITPLIHGGAHTLSNILPACRSCNGKKGHRAVLKPVQPVLIL